VHREQKGISNRGERKSVEGKRRQEPERIPGHTGKSKNSHSLRVQRALGSLRIAFHHSSKTTEKGGGCWIKPSKSQTKVLTRTSAATEKSEIKRNENKPEIRRQGVLANFG